MTLCMALCALTFDLHTSSERQPDTQTETYAWTNLHTHTHSRTNALTYPHAQILPSPSPGPLFEPLEDSGPLPTYFGIRQQACCSLSEHPALSAPHLRRWKTSTRCIAPNEHLSESRQNHHSDNHALQQQHLSLICQSSLKCAIFVYIVVKSKNIKTKIKIINYG